MSSSSRNLLRLPDDALLSILKWLRMDDLFRIEHTCKHLCSLSCSGFLWVSILKQLDVLNAPHFAPHERFGDLSALEIRSQVVRAMKLPHLLSSPDALRTKEIATFNLPSRIITNCAVFVNRLKPQIIPGGSFILLERQGQLEIWEVRTSRRIWIGPEHSDYGPCYSFGAELQEGGKKLFAAATRRNLGNGRNELCVYEICLENLEASILCRCEISMSSLAPLSIRSDIVMIRHAVDHAILLLDWKKDSFISLHFCNEEGNVNVTAAVLTETHILAVLYVGAFTLLAIPLSSLASHWSPACISSSAQGIDSIDIDLRTATDLNPCPEDQTGLNLLRFNLDKPKDGKEGPWAITIHAFAPPWKYDNEDVALELYIAGYGKPLPQTQTQPQSTSNFTITNIKTFLSWRLQLSRASPTSAPSPASQAAANSISNTPPSSLVDVQASTKDWTLTLITSSCAPASSLPWNAQGITNNGHMLAFDRRQGLRCFKLFENSPQPMTVSRPQDSSTQTQVSKPNSISELLGRSSAFSRETMDPYSGILAIQTQDEVKIVNFD